MYGITGMPDLLPPTGALQPSTMVLSDPLTGPGNGNHNALDRHPPHQRIAQRPPKLGQIGRSKRVDLEDEDLDILMNNNNNNRRFPASMEVSPVA